MKCCFQEIADQGGVRFSCFVPFLESTDEFHRSLAAFQVCWFVIYLIFDRARYDVDLFCWFYMHVEVYNIILFILCMFICSFE